MIRRDYYANPWRDHARQNGIQAGRQTYSDLHTIPRRRRPRNAITALVVAAIPSIALWALAIWITARVVVLLVA